MVDFDHRKSLFDSPNRPATIEVYNSSQLEGSREIRFSQEYGAYFRDEAGAITDEGFTELAKEAIEAYIEQYLI